MLVSSCLILSKINMKDIKNYPVPSGYPFSFISQKLKFLNLCFHFRRFSGPCESHDNDTGNGYHSSPNLVS